MVFTAIAVSVLKRMWLFMRCGGSVIGLCCADSGQGISMVSI